jgi:hypothetical protein
MVDDPDNDGWKNSPGRKAWLDRQAARRERREVAAALAAGPDPELALDVLAVAARSEMTDANFRAVGLLLSILHRPSFLRQQMSLERQLAAERIIALAPKTPNFLSTISPSPKGNDGAPDRVDMRAIARGVAGFQDHLGLNAEHARANALADGVASGKVTKIDVRETAKFILQSADRAAGKEPRS